MGLRCTSCGYDNDPTRVYCHNCGVKLERGTATPPPAAVFTPPAQAVKLKRPRQPVPWRKYFDFVLKLVVLSGLAAVVALALLPPRDVPEPLQPDEGLATRLSGLLRDSAAATSPRSFDVPAADVHQWFVTCARVSEAADSSQLKPRRVYSALGDQVLRVGVETSLFDTLSIYFEGDYIPVQEGAVYNLRPVRYSIGRLPLPVALGWPVARQIAGLRDALVDPLAALSKASYIGVAPDAVTIRWSGDRVE